MPTEVTTVEHRTNDERKGKNMKKTHNTPQKSDTAPAPEAPAVPAKTARKLGAIQGRLARDHGLNFF